MYAENVIQLRELLFGYMDTVEVDKSKIMTINTLITITKCLWKIYVRLSNNLITVFCYSGFV